MGRARQRLRSIRSRRRAAILRGVLVNVSDDTKNVCAMPILGDPSRRGFSVTIALHFHLRLPPASTWSTSSPISLFHAHQRNTWDGCDGDCFAAIDMQDWAAQLLVNILVAQSVFVEREFQKPKRGIKSCEQ